MTPGCRGAVRGRVRPAKPERHPRLRDRVPQARPTCGIWIRWSISAIPVKPASAAAPAMLSSPPHRVLTPGEARQLQDEFELAGRRGRAGAGRGTGSDPAVVTTTTSSQSSRPELARHPFDLLQLRRQGRRRDRPVPGRIARAAHRVRGVEANGGGPKTGPQRQFRDTRADGRGPDPACRRTRGQVALHPRGHDLIQQTETRRPRHPDRAGRCRPPHGGRRTTRSRTSGSGSRPRSICPIRRRRSGRRAPGRPGRAPRHRASPDSPRNSTIC